MLRSTLIAGTAALAAVLLGAGPALAARLNRSPTPANRQDAYINGIAARTDTDAWAVGSVASNQAKWARCHSSITGTGQRGRGRARRASCHQRHPPGLGERDQRPDAWAVGTINLVKHPGYFEPIDCPLERLDLDERPDPLPLNPGTALVGVADISSTDAYTIGNQGSEYGLVEHGTAPHGTGRRTRRRSLSPTGTRSPRTRSTRSPPPRQATCGSSGPTCKPYTATQGPVLSALGRHRVEPHHDAAGQRRRLHIG